MEGFFEEVAGAEFHGFDGGGDVAVAGDEQDGEQGTEEFDLAEQFEAVHFRHTDVGNKQVAGAVGLVELGEAVNRGGEGGNEVILLEDLKKIARISGQKVNKKPTPVQYNFS